MASLLLERRADLAAAGVEKRRGAGPLLLAVASGAADLCELLVASGLRLREARCHARAGAASWAAQAGDLRMCRWLAEHRADFEEADAEGRTPLHRAARHGAAEPELAAWL